MKAVSRADAAYVAGLALLVVLALRSSLFSGLVATGRYNDIGAQFAVWRAWGFAEIAAGRFPLWNPLAFGGSPFHGAFEPGLLYPPNWLHLLLPLEAALNAVLILHVWLAGASVYFWARRRGVSAAGAFAGGSAFMFSGPLFLRLYAGHLPYLCAAAWLPALLLVIDELRAAASARWTAAGAVVAALLVLAGNPQVAWIAALTAALYAPLGLPPAPRRARYALSLAAVGLGGAALSSAQWLPGIAAALESTRWSGRSADAAADFALRARDVWSLVGPVASAGYVWESCLHLGAFALALALWGGRKKEGRAALACALILLLLAFAPTVPFAGGLFRAPGRLALPSFAFLSLLCAAGYDAAAARLGRWAPALAGAVVLESLLFAAGHAAAEPIRRDVPAAWTSALAELSPGERVIFDMRTDPDAGMLLGAPEVWGYGQLVPRRWAELLFASQGYPPETAGASLIVRRDVPLLRLLRARFVLRRGPSPVARLAPPLPRLLLVRSWSLASGRDESLAAVLAPGFDPAKTVVLEESPVPAPDPAGRGGTARVTAEDSDSLTIEAELPSPAILVLADSYASGWRADGYRVLAADHAMRAIALSAGRHRLVLRYAPAAFTAGAATSLVSWAGLAAWAAIL